MTGKMNPMTGSLEEDWETEPHDLCVVWNTMQYHAILSHPRAPWIVFEGP